MPRRGDLKVEQLAEAIVRREEERAGRTVRKLSKTEERRRGCDLISTDAVGRTRLIEVKGWGESLLLPSGVFRYPTELRTAQHEASRDPTWRLEIVANLTAASRGDEPYQRLRLTGADLAGRASPMLWSVSLGGFEARIEDGERLSLEGIGPDGSDTAYWADMLGAPDSAAPLDDES